MTQRLVSRLLAAGLVSGLLAACGGTTAGGGGDTTCLASGTGVLELLVAGLPQGVPSVLTVTGPSGTQTLQGGGTLQLAGGSYTVRGGPVAQDDPMVRKAFAPTPASSTVCVRDGQSSSATVSYTQIPSSHKLWTGSAPGGTAPLVGFAPAVLGSSGSPAATVAAVTRGTGGFTFDREGNLWVVGGTTVDPPLLRYPASALGASGTKAHDVALDSAVFGGGFPRATVVAFDASGNLWANVVWARKLVRFTPEQLAASGMPVPAVEISNLEGPAAIAFDASGNLWTTSHGRVVRFDTTRLGTSTSDAPDLTVIAQSPPPVIGPLPAAKGLAFDAEGNLWVSFDRIIAKLTPEEQSGTGEVTLTPSVQLALSVAALPAGIAFDESGGLWLAYSAGKFARLAPEQLTGISHPGNPTIPERIIESPDVGYAGSFALYPAPAALPLYHRLP
jgi:streptogramin lyase